MKRGWLSWLIIGSLGVLGCLAIGLGLHSKSAKTAAPLPPAHVPVDRGTATTAPTTPGPNELSIPSIGVKASVVPVSLVNHELGVPSNVHLVGEYDQGAATSADSGTTLIDGHVNWYNQGPGALANLADVHINAPIYLTDNTGAVTRWRVRSVRGVVKSDLPQDIFSSRGPRQLAIVTCGGALLGSGHYEDNVIVLASPAN